MEREENNNNFDETLGELEARVKEENKINGSKYQFKGLMIHEINPIRFGGSPTDPANKCLLVPERHAEITTWWNRLLRDIKSKKEG